jgi:glutamate-1-semialdehyde 2,1-aminomutase
MRKLVREPVIATMRERGERLTRGLAERLTAHGAASFLSQSGHPTWSFLTFADAPGATSWEIKTLFLQEVFERGILTLGTHNISYAHSPEDIDRLLQVYDEVLPFLAKAVANGAVRQYLRCEPLVPLFRVR